MKGIIFKLILNIVIGPMIQRLLGMLHSLVLYDVTYGMNIFTSSRRFALPDLLITVDGELGYLLYTYVFSQ